MATTGWLTADETGLDTYWPNHDLDLGALQALLTSARLQCEAYAPALPDGSVVPETYRLAQALQARALFRSSRAGSGDQIGAEGLAVTVFPMDWTVKNLLRPRRVGRVL